MICHGDGLCIAQWGDVGAGHGGVDETRGVGGGFPVAYEGQDDGVMVGLATNNLQDDRQVLRTDGNVVVHELFDLPADWPLVDKPGR